MSEIVGNVNEQMSLIFKYNNKDDAREDKIATQNYIDYIAFFPKYYLDALEDSIFPEHYFACFSYTKDDCSMWGHYAEGHRGVCLIFEPEENKDGAHILKLDKGSSLSLYKVNYSKKPPAINFFENIAYLPKVILYNNWLTDSSKLSDLSSFYGDDFHDIFWKRYADKVAFKFKDWEYENEVRAVEHTLWEKKEKANRVYRYDIKQLKGIIFGMNTPENVKMEIFKIMEEKVKENNMDDFKFHSAVFSPTSKKIDIRPMNLLQFKSDKVRNK